MTVDGSCFVDTNVLVYAFDRTEKKRREKAAKLIHDLAGTNRIVLSTQVLQEIFVTMTRKIKEPLAVNKTLEILEDFAAWRLFTVDLRAILDAGSLSHDNRISFWDALIVVSARQTGASTLYSEDLNHGQEISGVRVVNPFE